MGFLDIFKISALKEEIESLKNENLNFKKENAKLSDFIKEIGADKAIEVTKKIMEYEATKEDLRNQCLSLETKKDEIAKQIGEKQKELIVLDDEILLETFALYKPKFSFLTSEEYKNNLDAIRNKQKELIKSGTAVFANENWTVNNSKSEGKKMVNDMKKLLLRSFNNECDYCVDNVKFNNIESSETRIEKSYDALNKLGRIMSAQINIEYKNLKYKELYLAFEYQQKKQEEKEEQKRAREELREQQKLEQEIRQARERITKEKKHFMMAIKDLELKLKNCKEEEERSKICQKLEDTRNQYMELEKEEKVIDYRERNAKAGYVYIISNLGAFGENVYKIGMTRRLEPMDRIDELGDASVPFPFDVHALIFSENAPELENKLHTHFSKNRINKLNNRKEFFRANIHEIESVIKENYDKVVDISKEASAEQYRESLLIND